MRIDDCMTREPSTVQATQSINKAAEIMRDQDIGTVPVMSDSKLVGILTDRDIVVRGIAAHLDLENHQVQEIMSADPQVASVDTEIEQVARLMSDSKIRRLPIVEDGQLVGVVSLGDIAIAHGDHEEMCAHILESVSSPLGAE